MKIYFGFTPVTAQASKRQGQSYGFRRNWGMRC
jgi:hypothetical protein